MYEKEADELINLVLTVPADAEDFGGRSRTREVADWLREFVAASNYGCTGLTVDPDGPELAAHGPESDATDPVASGAEVLADATQEEVDGFLEAIRKDHPDAYAYGEPWGPDNPAPGSAWGRRPKPGLSQPESAAGYARGGFRPTEETIDWNPDPWPSGLELGPE
jgi:hypothetical protein